MRSAFPIVDQLVAQRIRERRKSLRLTLRVLAERVGVSVQQLWKYERCENNISAGLLYKIASALHTSPEYFFESLEEQAPPPLPPRQRLILDLVRSLHKIERKDHWGGAQSPSPRSNDSLPQRQILLPYTKVILPPTSVQRLSAMDQEIDRAIFGHA
jgi:transcriptional regulator with XRE-family HTH domain